MPAAEGRRLRVTASPGARTWRVLFWLAVVVGVVLALWPHPEPEAQLFPLEDKVRHALAFATLIGLGSLSRFRSMPRLAFGLLLLGAAIEVAQGFTATRSAEWGDLAADAIGIGAGWLLLRLREP